MSSSCTNTWCRNNTCMHYLAFGAGTGSVLWDQLAEVDARRCHGKVMARSCKVHICAKGHVNRYCPLCSLSSRGANTSGLPRAETECRRTHLNRTLIRLISLIGLIGLIRPQTLSRRRIKDWDRCSGEPWLRFVTIGAGGDGQVAGGSEQRLFHGARVQGSRVPRFHGWADRCQPCQP